MNTVIAICVLLASFGVVDNGGIVDSIILIAILGVLVWFLNSVGQISDTAKKVINLLFIIFCIIIAGRAVKGML